MATLAEIARRLVDPPALRRFLARFREPDLRLALRLCLPAVAIGFVLRAVLIASSPSAFIHNDTAPVVETASRLVNDGVLVIGGKKTFLLPLLYCIPAVLGIPILPFAAVVQHLLGLIQLFALGLLCFAWLRHWRILIPPVTILIAINPTLLWYEHAALPECYAVFGALLVVLAVTLLTRSPSRYSLALTLGALFFAAGARPEGRFFCLLAVAATFRAAWPTWRMRWSALAAMIVWSAFLFSITRTQQGGTLLFASLLHLTPERLAASPGIAEAIAPVRNTARSEWQKPTGPGLVKIRKAMRDALIEEQKRRGVPQRAAEGQVDALASRAAFETALRNAPHLPGLALQKFILGHRELPVPLFSSYAVDGQFAVCVDEEEPQKILRYSSLIWGASTPDPTEIAGFLARSVHPGGLEWLSALQSWCVRIGLTPAVPPPDRVLEHFGIPWLYALALLGAVFLCARERPVLGPVFLCTAFLVALCFVLMITANTRARFRLVFEPFWYLYLAALADTLIAASLRIRSLFPSSPHPPSSPSPRLTSSRLSHA